MLKSIRALALLALGMILGAAAASATAGPPLPFIQGKAVITRITTAISGDPAKPTITVEATALNDGLVLGGNVSIITANSQAADQFTVGSTVKLVLGGK